MAEGGAEMFDYVDAKTVRRLDMVKRAVALDLDRRVVHQTPVDTGRARASWHVTRDAVDLSTAVVPPHGGGQLSPPPATTLSASDDPASVIYVSNNVPYIGALNDGHSRQAPAGYVDAAVEATRTYFEQIAGIVVAHDGGL